MIARKITIENIPALLWDEDTRDGVVSLAKRFGCELTVIEEGVHYFHTPEQLAYYREWLKQRLK